MKEERSIKMNLILLLPQTLYYSPPSYSYLNQNPKTTVKSIKQKQKASANLSKAPTPVSNPNDLTPAKLLKEKEPHHTNKNGINHTLPLIFQNRNMQAQVTPTIQSWDSSSFPRCQYSVPAHPSHSRVLPTAPRSSSHSLVQAAFLQLHSDSS
jgi:hypothetical protein